MQESKEEESEIVEYRATLALIVDFRQFGLFKFDACLIESGNAIKRAFLGLNAMIVGEPFIIQARAVLLHGFIRHCQF